MKAALRRMRVELRWGLGLRALPLRVALFLTRARWLALRSGDVFSLVSATRPANLALLLELAQGRRRVVELGTGTGWTALALAVDDELRTVTSYDAILRPERAAYGRVAGASAKRVAFVDAPGAAGPCEARDVDLLYIDSSHEREATIEEFGVWRPVLAPGAIVVFDDYGHPEYPGVREAVEALGLSGEPRGTVFVHTVGA